MATIFRALSDQPNQAMIAHMIAQEHHERALARLNASLGNAEHGSMAWVEWEPVGPASYVRGLIEPERIPKGWISPTPGFIAPDTRTRRGRRAARTLAHLQPPPDPRSRFLGMPGWTLIGDRYLSPAVEHLQGRVYVRWECEPHEIGPVNPALWEPMPDANYQVVRDLETIERTVRAEQTHTSRAEPD